MHFAFSFLLKNMLFCYSLLAATNHKTYQQIERSNNFFQKKFVRHGSCQEKPDFPVSRLSLRRKKASRPDAGDQFCVANRLVEAGRVQFSSEKVPRTLSKAQEALQALPEPLCGLLLGSHLFLQLILYLLMGPVPGLMAFAAKDRKVGLRVVPTVRQRDPVVLFKPRPRGLDLALCAMTDGAHRSVETANLDPCGLAAPLFVGLGGLFRWTDGRCALRAGPQNLAHKIAGALQDRIPPCVADRAREDVGLLVERRVQYKLQSLPRPAPHLTRHVAWSPFCRREVPLRRQAASLLHTYGTHDKGTVLFRHRQKTRRLVAMGAARRLPG